MPHGAVGRTNSPGLLIRSSVPERRSLIIVHGFYLGFGSSSLPWSVCRLAAATAENQNVVNLNESYKIVDTSPLWSAR